MRRSFYTFAVIYPLPTLATVEVSFSVVIITVTVVINLSKPFT